MGHSQKKSSTVVVLVGLVLLIGAAVFGYSHFGGNELLTKIKQSATGGEGASQSGDGPKQATVYAVTTYDDPVPKSLVIPEDLLEMITTKTAKTEAVSVGEVEFGIEANNIVGGRDDGSFELAGGRVLHPVTEFDDWSLDTALEEAGFDSDSKGFDELKGLSYFDQHDVLLTTTSESGLKYDYDISPKAALAIKEQLIGTGRPVFRYRLKHRDVIQVGHATDRDGTRVIVYFPSDNIRAVDVTGHAQESIYWLVARMLEPDYEAATAKIAERSAKENQAESLNEEDDLAGKGDGAVEVAEPVGEERL